MMLRHYLTTLATNDLPLAILPENYLAKLVACIANGGSLVLAYATRAGGPAAYGAAAGRAAVKN